MGQRRITRSREISTREKAFGDDLRRSCMSDPQTYPQFFARILQVFEYKIPSLPQAGLAPRQHDSRQCLVVWQCFLFVRTTPWLRTKKVKIALRPGTSFMLE